MLTLVHHGTHALVLGAYGGGSHCADGDTACESLSLVFLTALIVALIIGGLFAFRMNRRRTAQARRVEQALDEAAADDPAFAAEAIRDTARRLFLAVQAARASGDRAQLATLAAPEQAVAWTGQMDRLAAKSLRRRIEVTKAPKIDYLGLVNRAGDSHDEVVVRIDCVIVDYCEQPDGKRHYRVGQRHTRTLREYWTLDRPNGDWRVRSVERDRQGAKRHLRAPVVASPHS